MENYISYFVKCLLKKIRELRRRKGLSQEKLARLANVSFITVVKIESGESEHPTVQTYGGNCKGFRDFLG